MNHKLAQFLQRLTMMAIAAAFASIPALLFAQSSSQTASGLARPKTTQDGVLEGFGGYAMRYYFQEGKDFTDKDAHVYYEPMIYLVTNEKGELEHEIKPRRDGEVDLILYIKFHRGKDGIISALREELKEAAKQQDKNFNLEPGTEPYRISVLTPSKSSLSIKRSSGKEKNNVHVELNNSFTEIGEVAVPFPMKSEDEANMLLSNLQGNLVQFVFEYKFKGVSERKCTATAEYSRIQDIDLFKEVMGEGGKGSVSRDQVVDIMGEMIEKFEVNRRCNDGDGPKVSDLMEKLMEKLKKPEIKNWEDVDKQIAFNAESFKADVENKIRESSQEVHRKFILDIVDKSIDAATTDDSGAKVGGSYGGIGLNLSRNRKEAESMSTEEQQKAIDKVLSDLTVEMEWTGERYIPKSLDVHTKASLRTSLASGLTVEYTVIKDSDGTGSVILTDQARLKTTPYVEWLKVNSTEGGADVQISARNRTRISAEGADQDGAEQENVVELEINATQGDVGIFAKDDVGIDASDDVDIGASDKITIFAKGADQDGDELGEEELLEMGSHMIGVITSILNDGADVEGEDPWAAMLKGMQSGVVELEINATQGDVGISAKDDVNIDASNKIIIYAKGSNPTSSDIVKLIKKIAMPDKGIVAIFAEDTVAAMSDGKVVISGTEGASIVSVHGGVVVGGEDSIMVQSRKENVYIVARDKVQIDGKEIEINGENFPYVATCFYELQKNRKKASTSKYYHDLGRNDNTAFISGVEAYSRKNSCSDTTGLSWRLTRKNVSTGNWMLLITDYSDCDIIGSRIVFMGGAGVEEDGTNRPAITKNYDQLRKLDSWCTGN